MNKVIIQTEKSFLETEKSFFGLNEVII